MTANKSGRQRPAAAAKMAVAGLGLSVTLAMTGVLAASSDRATVDPAAAELLVVPAAAKPSVAGPSAQQDPPSQVVLTSDKGLPSRTIVLAVPRKLEVARPRVATRPSSPSQSGGSTAAPAVAPAPEPAPAPAPQTVTRGSG